jgi:nitrite reductase (NO-forming)
MIEESLTTVNVLSQLRSLSAVTLFRIAFGIVWLLDGLMKFTWLQSSDVIKLAQGAGQSQPTWLHPWYNFWIASVTSAPTAFLYSTGVFELALGVALIVGFLRKTAYLAGIMLSLMIWAIDEGFGGPYGPGSTDIGAAIMYVFVFVAIIIAERSVKHDKYSLDALIERKLNGWRHLSELYNENQISSKRPRLG